LIKRSQIFADRAGNLLLIWPWRELALGLAPRDGIGLNDTGINREAFPADQASLQAQANDLLKELPEQVALTETAVAVLGEGRVIRYVAFQAQTAKPAIGQVEVDLLSSPALRADGKGITNQQHADHQLRIDRGPSASGIIGGQAPSDRAEVQDRVNPSTQMVSRDMPLEVKFMKKLRWFVSPPHHATISEI
jgi:hypothetical protein